ncbi:MAG: hypothetical protein ACLQHK_00920 [Gallionellaceae bacterium]
MFGLAYLVVFGLYLLISIGVVRWAISYARKNGKSAKRWGWSTAFVMYSIVFWDWIPTVAVQQFYCAKDSGFWVYKTLDQWKAENPGVAETLVVNKGAPSREERFDDRHGKTDTYLLNDRFNWIVIQQDIFRPLSIIRTEQQVKDVQKNEVLARYVDFSSGHSVTDRGVSLRFWVNIGNCSGGEINKSKLIHFADDGENISTQGGRK